MTKRMEEDEGPKEEECRSLLRLSHASWTKTWRPLDPLLTCSSSVAARGLSSLVVAFLQMEGYASIREIGFSLADRADSIVSARGHCKKADVGMNISSRFGFPVIRIRVLPVAGDPRRDISAAQLLVRQAEVLF